LPGDVAVKQRLVRRDRLAPEKILDLDRPDVVDAVMPPGDLREAGQHADFDPDIPQRFHDLTSPVP
jgi:hypothetical protein